jgi:hypothetical protein
MAGPIQEMLMQPQSWGEVSAAMRRLSGPTSYANGTGQKISANAFGFNALRALFLGNSIDMTGTWFVRVQDIGDGAQPYFLVRWYVLATGAEVANTTNLSTGKIRYMGVSS